jgi:hypothetical protein
MKSGEKMGSSLSGQTSPRKTYVLYKTNFSNHTKQQLTPQMPQYENGISTMKNSAAMQHGLFS